MPLPAPLSRRKQDVYKNQFGHILILAGSKRMLGAAALCSLAAMRSGAGLVTLGIPSSLNSFVQKKISNVIMTLPLKETKEQSLSLSALKEIQSQSKNFDAIAIGPGLSTHPNTAQLVLNLIKSLNVPMVLDADALNAISQEPGILLKSSSVKVLTPHPGEMARLTKLSKSAVEKNRINISRDFAKKYKCTVLLKGHQTCIVSDMGRVYINKTGNSGMATAGSGDVLTGMIAAFLGQGLTAFQAAKLGAFLHGKAGDLAAKSQTKASLIASDIIDFLPNAFKSSQRRKANKVRRSKKAFHKKNKPIRATDLYGI